MLHLFSGNRQDQQFLTLCQAVIEQLYARNQTQQTVSQQHHDVSLTYGEIFFTSMQILFEDLQLTEQDVFLDCGSGYGKVALQSFFMTPVRQVIGIEWDQAKHEVAMKCVQSAKEALPIFWEGERDILLLQGDFLSSVLEQVTVAYSCSTCFTETLSWDLGQHLEKFPNLRCVLSLKPLPALKTFTYQGIIPIECSWDSALCYIYKKVNN